MVALWNMGDHYIFALWFLLLLLSFFFPSPNLSRRRWMSAILPHMADLRCRSEVCCTRLAGNAGPKKVAKNLHLSTIAQLCPAISSQLRRISTIGRKLVKQQYVLQMSPQYGEFRPMSG